MTVNIQRPIKFKYKCQCETSEMMLEKAMLWHANGKPMRSIKAIFMHGRYPAISIYGKKIHIHRLLAMFMERRKLESHEIVHHIDGNPMNGRIDNFKIMSQADHIRGHLKGKPQDAEFAKRRMNLSCLARYGHEIHEDEK